LEVLLDCDRHSSWKWHCGGGNLFQAKGVLKMKTLLLATTALALGIMSANAADMTARPYTKAAPIMAPTWNWSGFYIGGNVGYAVSRSDTGTGVFAPGTAALVTGTTGNNAADGVVGGGQIGWNTMFAPAWLFGIEADIQAADQSGSQTLSLVANAPTSFATVESRLNWFGTVRGRLGWTATPETLLYVTGGYAYGETEVRNSSSVIAGGIPVLGGSSTKGIKDGWTVGGGVETRLWNSNWTGKLEYLYMDLGTQTTANFLVGPAGNFQASSVDFKDHIIRVGLNYKLGNWAY
jgi:outer membrane immunogenic protein